MTRPVIDPAALQSNEEAWDALLRDIIAALVDKPLPLKAYVNLAAFPDPNLYDDCLAVASDTHDLYLSVAGVWTKMTRAL